MNIVKAIFSGGCTQITAAEALWQWDQGQILQIVGLDLPDAYQVEFSNQPVRGSAAPMIGGVGGVEIPDVYLTTGRDIYAFVVLHSGETDRETEYRITIHVNARPQPTDVQPTPEQQGVIDQLIAALNAGVDRAEDAADEAEGSAGDAATQAQAAAQSAISSASSASDAAAQAGLAATAKAGADAALAAALVAQGNAESFAAAASGAEAAAETAQGKAEDAQAAAETAEAAAESAKAGALAAKAAAETAQGKAEDAQAAAEQAAQAAHVEYEQLAGQVEAQGQTISQQGQTIAQNTADIADLDADLAQQKSAIDDLTALVDRKAGMLVDSVSGAIASFVPDATIDNLLGVSVDIEPVQDLHGYDSPWPAGGGANMFNPETVAVGYISDSTGEINSQQTQSRSSDYIAVLPSTSYYIGNSAPSGRWGAWYDENKTYISACNGAGVKTSPSNASYMRITVSYLNNNPDFAYNVIVAQSSSEVPFSPYSNECPISGWDSVEVERTGINLFDKTDTTRQIVDSYFAGNTAIASSGGRMVVWVPCKHNTTYTIHRDRSSAESEIRFAVGTTEETPAVGVAVSQYIGYNRLSYTITTSDSAKFLVVLAYWSNLTEALDSLVIELDYTATEYKPYAGNRYTRTYPETVYGGKDEVTGGGATADQTKAIFDGSEAWVKINYATRNRYTLAVADLKKISESSSIDGLLANYLKSAKGGDWTIEIISGGRLDVYIPFGVADTLAEWKAYLAQNNLEVVYPLDTPTVLSLDPVTISTVSGQTNNAWSDAGDVSVTYAADVKTYIDNKIAAAVAALS